MSERLVFIFLYFVLLLVILPLFCSDKVYSMLYQEDVILNQEIDDIKSEHRKRGALNYMLSLEGDESLLYHENRLLHPVDNLIVVIAKKPESKDDLVLSQLVTEVDRNIRSERVYRNGLIVCNATRISFGELDVLSRFYPVKQAQNTSTWRLFNKEEVIKHDLMDCLTLAVNYTSTKHITVIRDKVVPYSGFLQSLNTVLSTQLSNIMQRGDLRERDPSWLFMHLHEPVPWRHYSFSLNSIRELFLIACSGSLIFYFIFRFLERNQYPVFAYGSFAFFGAIYFLTMALVIGRPYISELRRCMGALYRVYDPGEPVYFSAISFPSNSINEILLHLKTIHCSSYRPFYDVFDHMVNTLEKPGFVISPSLFKYVVKT